VVVLVGRGLGAMEIAEGLVISLATAKTHVNRSLAKPGARDHARRGRPAGTAL